MSTLTHTPTLGLEFIARQTLIYLMESLNDRLSDQEQTWEPLDQELFVLRGGAVEDFTPLDLEGVPVENFHLGHRPSLINAPIEGYPNVSVYADQSAPADDDADLDQVASNELNLVIEIMAKSSTSEEEVNSRIQRMADAVNIALMDNRTLSGLVHEISAQPTVGFSELFPRKEKTAYGNEWYWQGARFEYPVKKEAALPSGGSSLRPAIGPLSNVMPGIDQN